MYFFAEKCFGNPPPGTIFKTKGSCEYFIHPASYSNMTYNVLMLFLAWIALIMTSSSIVWDAIFNSTWKYCLSIHFILSIVDFIKTFNTSTIEKTPRHLWFDMDANQYPKTIPNVAFKILLLITGTVIPLLKLCRSHNVQENLNLIARITTRAGAFPQGGHILYLICHLCVYLNYITCLVIALVDWNDHPEGAWLEKNATTGLPRLDLWTIGLNRASNHATSMFLLTIGWELGNPTGWFKIEFFTSLAIVFIEALIYYLYSENTKAHAVVNRQLARQAYGEREAALECLLQSPGVTPEMAEYIRERFHMDHPNRELYVRDALQYLDAESLRRIHQNLSKYLLREIQFFENLGPGSVTSSDVLLEGC